MDLRPPQQNRGIVRTAALKAGTVVVVMALIFAARSVGGLRVASSASSQPLPSESSLPANKSQTATGNTSGSTSLGSPSPSASPTSTSSNKTNTTTSTSTTSSASPTPTASTTATLSTPKPTSTPAPTPTPTPSPTPTATFRDGTYSAVGSYATNGFTEKIGISLTISGGVITATSATNMAVNPTSKNYQNDFIANYKPYVIGRSISSLSLGKVATSSLTPNGFNAATSSIKLQAN